MSHSIQISPAPLVREYSCTEDLSIPNTLSDPDIHVWQKNTETSEVELARLQSLLSDDEQARASRYRFDADRNEFVVSRGTLRILLSAYLGTEPHLLRFAYTEFARPVLTGMTGGRALNFNVSHSDGITLWAFAVARRIGVDVEKVRQDSSTMEIAERFFSTEESRMLRGLPAGQRHEAFFRCWTRKEAFIKALGEGLSHPLDSFDVSLAPGEPAQLVATRPDHEVAKRWAMWDVSAPQGYAAALTAEVK